VNQSKLRVAILLSIFAFGGIDLFLPTEVVLTPIYALLALLAGWVDGPRAVLLCAGAELLTSDLVMAARHDSNSIMSQLIATAT
jgi:hypothetical protein